VIAIFHLSSRFSTSNVDEHGGAVWIAYRWSLTPVPLRLAFLGKGASALLGIGAVVDGVERLWTVQGVKDKVVVLGIENSYCHDAPFCLLLHGIMDIRPGTVTSCQRRTPHVTL
jgi:hypothetical protein